MTSPACATADPWRIAPAVWLVREPAWHTTSVLMQTERDAVLVGPGFDTEAVNATWEPGGAAGPQDTHLLVTHVDFDHLRGIGRLPGATVWAGRDTATALADHRVRERYASLADAAGQRWAAEPRVDAVFDPPTTIRCGGLALEALAVPGHTPDSVAFVAGDLQVLLAGDYLSSVTYPLVTGEIADAIESQRLLLDIARRADIRLVAPGHGPPLSPQAAVKLAREDLGYLEGLRDAAVSAAHDGLTGEGAIDHIAGATTPPRAATGGFETLDMHRMNAARASDGATSNG